MDNHFCPNDGSYLRTSTMSLPEGTTSLVFQCRCGYYKEASDKDTKVYSRNYTNAPLVEQIKHNRYFLIDPTLPCVSDVKCANPDCLTNDKRTGFVIFSHGNADLTDKELSSALTVIPGYKEYKRIGLESVAVMVEGAMPEGCKIAGRMIEAEPYKKPEDRAIMIKYDPANMKYLYICCCCGHNRE